MTHLILGRSTESDRTVCAVGCRAPARKYLPPTLGILAITAFLAVMPPVPASPSSEKKDELKVIIDYPDGKQKTRLTYEGQLQPLGMYVNQLVTVTLDFGNNYKGAVVEIAAMREDLGPEFRQFLTTFVAELG